MEEVAGSGKTNRIYRHVYVRVDLIIDATTTNLYIIINLFNSTN